MPIRFGVAVVKLLAESDEKVGSSSVRQALATGDVNTIQPTLGN